jgi:hypothetical protein
MLGGILGCSVAESRPAATQVVRPYPAGCEAFGFSARRCAAIVAIARNDLKIQDPAAAVELLSEAPRHDCGPQPDGTVILCTRSGGGIAVIVRITPPAGTAREATFPCGVGGQHSIACTATPELLLRTPMDGYGDIACTGEDAAGNPTGCATPLPPIEPDALAAAQPLTVQWLEIPIDRDGPDEIEIGRVGIPNGRLSEARFAVERPSLDDVLFDDEGIVLAVEPVDPAGRPFLNKYEHGWLPGVEVARVVLRFTVIQHEPGATLPIRDLVVR